jgi:site-specific DNA-methyltransferase (cytosine-N4-specific)
LHGLQPLFENDELTLYCGNARDVLPQLPVGVVQAALTSPPYWGLKNYGVPGQLGQEPTPDGYVNAVAACCAELRRLLAHDGTLWLNLGDSYITNPGNGRGGERVEGGRPNRSATDKTSSGLPLKNLVGIPWRVALALQADGWILRSDVIWEKPNVKPDGAKDRPTIAHEYVFLFSKSRRYYYDADGVAEPANGGTTRNRRSVWRIPTVPFAEAHFACWPPALAQLMIRASTQEGEVVLDPFFGAGTTALAARALGRKTIGIEINRDYCELALRRLGHRA